MKAIIHAGLHKTGTSSLQGILLEYFGVQKEGFPWFPRPEILWPGHTHMFLECCGAKGVPQTFAKLDDILLTAKEAGASHLLLSSEDIYELPESRLDQTFERIFNYCNEVSVVLTANPYAKRFVSSYVEMVKGGHQGEFNYSFHEIMSYPALNNEILERFLIFLSKRPEVNGKLIVNGMHANGNIGNDFLAINGVDFTVPVSSMPANVSLDEFSCEFWRLMNRYRVDLGGPTYHLAQDAIQALMETAAWHELRRHTPTSRFSLLPQWRQDITHCARVQYDLFRSYADACDWSVHGDINDINKDDAALYLP